MSSSVNFVRKGIVGRVNSARLYAFNSTLKKDALRERGYWEVSKESHPVNRWWFKRWEKNEKMFDIYIERDKQIPVDQKFKVARALRVFQLMVYAPLLVVAYLIFCYAKFKLFGVTALDDSTVTLMSACTFPKAPH